LPQAQVTLASATVAASGEPDGAAVPAPWPGAKLGPLVASVAVGLALRFLVPAPAGVSLQAWTLLAIFVSTIAGAPTRLLHARCAGRAAVTLTPRAVSQPAAASTRGGRVFAQVWQTRGVWRFATLPGGTCYDYMQRGDPVSLHAMRAL